MVGESNPSAEVNYWPSDDRGAVRIVGTRDHHDPLIRTPAQKNAGQVFWVVPAVGFGGFPCPLIPEGE